MSTPTGAERETTTSPSTTSTTVAAAAWKRALAKLIDLTLLGLTIVGLTWQLPYVVAVAIGTAWFLASDWSGSPGKWMLGIRAVVASSGARPTPVQSIVRNAPFVLRNVCLAIGTLTTGLTATAFREEHRYVAGLIAITSLAIMLSMLVAVRRHPEGRRPLDAGVRVVAR